jgi:serine/threonine-protein kinase
VNIAVLAPKLCTTCGARYPADALFCPADGTPLSSAAAAHAAAQAGPYAPDPYLGREISGHIEIRQLAGVGAMGRVYRAFQKGIERDVAVKVLHRELSVNKQLVARFHREAKVASRLQHPNVVQVHLAGQLPDGALYIVMEYLDGLSLQSALAAAGGAMPLPRALHIALQLCDAAGEAHAQGIVHRDFKPENVMLVQRGEDADTVKVLDFGIARLNWGEQSMSTAAGLIFGTARYISPEGAQGEQVGPAGDVYSIATLLYQMLAGRTPFEGDQAVALLVQQIHDPPPALRSIGRSAYVPEAVAAAVMRNLVKDPRERDPDGRTFGRALLEAAKGSGLSPDELAFGLGRLTTKSGPIQLPPLAKTKQLELDAETAAKLAAPNGHRPNVMGNSGPPETGPNVWGGSAPPDTPQWRGSAPTTKWTPDAEFQARISPRPSLAEPKARGHRPALSSVDETLDDETAPPPPPVPPAPSSRPFVTQHASPLPQAMLAAPPAPESEPIRAAAPSGGEIRFPAAEPPAVGPPAPPSKPASNVESTLSDEEPRALRTRQIAVMLLFFVLGGMIMAVGAYVRGYLGPSARAGTLEDTVARATSALHQKRWDSPPGDNVKDLTNDGLKKWPREARLLDVRARATDELVKEALGRKFAGDVAEALKLARLARELDPTDTTAQQLVDQYEKELGKAEAPPPLIAPLPSATATAAGPVSTGTPKATGPAGYRAAFDASPAKPRVGQQIDFAVRLATASGAPPRSAAENPRFDIAGPGGRSATLPASVESTGMYRASISFLEPGKYDVVFNAKLEGVAVKVARQIVTGAVPGNDSPPASGGDAPPAPSGKWL